MHTDPYFARALLVLGAALSAGCALLPGKQTETPEATLPTWIGRVVMVDTAHRFALVETSLPPRLEPDARLLAFRERRVTAALAVTPENRQPYLAVQILSGMPVSGDTVALDESRPTEDVPTE
jgi:hypothetical protein